MPETKRPLKVFLCHASTDKPKVRELYRYLKKRGIQPWFDEESLVGGQNWEVEIPKALATSDAIIICLTKNSVDKEGYIQKEIKFALDKALQMPEGRIFLIPVKFEECEIPFSLSPYHWVDLTIESGYSKMMKALKFRASQLERSTVEISKRTAQEEKADREVAKKTRLEAEEQEKQKTAKEKADHDAAERTVREGIVRVIKNIALEKEKREAAERTRKLAEEENKLRLMKSEANRLEVDGDFEAALRIYREIVLIRPLDEKSNQKIEILKRAIYLENRAEEFSLNDDFEKALRDYNEIKEMISLPLRIVQKIKILEQTRKVKFLRIEVDDFEAKGDFERALQVCSQIYKIDSQFPGLYEKIKKLTLKKIESRAIQYELKGDFWDAQQTWYEIKKLDASFPRVDIKIRELERELHLKPMVAIAGDGGGPTVARKVAYPKFSPQVLLAIVGAIAVMLFAVIGSPSIVSLINQTPTPMVTSTPTKKPTPTKTLVPPSTKTKVPTSTPTPTLTLVPQGSILLQEDFEDNAVSNDWSSAYTIQKDSNGNHYWLATSTGAEYPSAWYFAKGTDDWKNYAFEVRIKFIKEGGIFIGSYAYPNAVSSFFVSFITSDGYVRLVEYNLPTFGWRVIDGTEKKSLITRNKWYLVRFEVQDSQLSTYVDNKLVTNTDMPQPAASESGTVGFYIGKDDEVHIDDIKVWQLK